MCQGERECVSVCECVWTVRLGFMRGLDQSPGRGQQQSDGELCHRVRQNVWGVAHTDPPENAHTYIHRIGLRIAT